MRSISLGSAVLVSINIIIGAGLFINPAPLTQLAHGWGFAAYLLAAIALVPLICCIAMLAALKPTSGGLYIYAHDFISPMAGFISGWCYFLGKSTSAALLVYSFCSFTQNTFTYLQAFDTKIISIAVLFLLALLNIIGLKIGGKIQWLFIILKMVPIALVLFTGFFYAQHEWPLQSFSLSALEQMPSALPIAIFALCGFEAICSIAHLIEKPHQNIRRAIIISFVIVALCSALFQYAMWLMVGPALALSHNPLAVYTSLIFGSHSAVAVILNGFVYASVMGAAFSMLSSNCWNLQTIARHGHIPHAHLLAKISHKQVPWVSLLVEVLIASVIIALQSDQIPLQNMAVFGMTVGYLMSTCAAWQASRSGTKIALPRWLVVLSFISCTYILALCALRILNSGASMVFLIILSLGIIAALWQKYFHTHKQKR